MPMPVRRPRSRAPRSLPGACVSPAAALRRPGQPARPASTGCVIPTPSPDPGDFVAASTTPGCRSTPGSDWRYESPASTARLDDDHGRRSPTTRARSPGVATTAVATSSPTPTAGSSRHVRLVRPGPARQRLVGSAGEGVVAGRRGRRRGRARRCRRRRGSATATARSTTRASAEDRAGCWRGRVAHDVARRRGTDLLQTEDTTPLEPDVVEHAFYARGHRSGRGGRARPATTLVELVRLHRAG